MVLKGVQDPGRLADLTAAHLSLDSSEAQEILEVIDPVERLQSSPPTAQAPAAKTADEGPNRASDAQSDEPESARALPARADGRSGAELGDSDEDDPIQELRDRIDMLELPEEALAEVLKQLRRLEGLNAESTEAANLRSYLDWICDLPWNETTEDKLDLKESEAILDSDHYGLNDVKERILEYLSVRQKNPELKGPILCLVGPPGVGKTSIGKSVARALGRRFERISLGGMRDEAEIRGHRTYVGAMPGRIIQAIKQAGTMNPVIMLDELDKVGSDFRGGPGSGAPRGARPRAKYELSGSLHQPAFDLSQVLFLANANLTDTIRARCWTGSR